MMREERSRWERSGAVHTSAAVQPTIQRKSFPRSSETFFCFQAMPDSARRFTHIFLYVYRADTVILPD